MTPGQVEDALSLVIDDAPISALPSRAVREATKDKSSQSETALPEATLAVLLNRFPILTELCTESVAETLSSNSKQPSKASSRLHAAVRVVVNVVSLVFALA